MSGFTPIEIVATLWAAVAIIYLALFLIRSVIGMKEEDNLYLSAGETRLAEEQKEIMKTITKWDSVTHKFGYAALAMTILLAGMWGFSVARQLF
jgi:hypothetical protein